VDKAEAKQKLGLNPESVLIFSIARIVSRKRLDLLVNAVNLLSKEKSSNFHVIIAGTGPDRINILNLVKRYRLEHIIKLPGWISDEQKHLYYQAADLFVLTSSYEGFPLTMLEAMSYGVAIVASKIQSLDSLRNGLDALLFSAGDSHSLSEIIRTLLNDTTLRTQLSHSARLFAETCSWENVAQETKYLYERLLDAKSRSLSPRATANESTNHKS
jgi:glycosyltransferase involved in cell wall biosynthesis